MPNVPELAYDKRLLFIEPTQHASVVAVIDHITKKMCLQELDTPLHLLRRQPARKREQFEHNWPTLYFCP